MKTPKPEIIECLREQYPVGCRVELLQMDDVLSRILDNGSYQYS